MSQKNKKKDSSHSLTESRMTKSVGSKRDKGKNLGDINKKGLKPEPIVWIKKGR